jgi:phospholipid/cholesterol/gamma-HCH transport system permease protein
VTNPITTLGAAATRITSELGRFAAFAGWIGRTLVTPPLRPRRLLEELYKQGALSVLIVCLCGLAVGMVLALQGYNTLARFGAENELGALVGLSLVRELGPVLTALLVIGRAGSATAAELGSMALTEQLDGLRMLAIDPIHLIVTPKALAMVVAVPLLTALFIISGVYGGHLVGVNVLGSDAGAYMASLRDAIVFRDDVAGSILKSLVFGVLIGLIATYRGYTAERTAEGVSDATTSTVVISSVSILLCDYILTALWGVNG